jgi:hypothetical protein
MTDYVNIRASETLNQGELVEFLKSRYPKIAKPVGRSIIEGTECVEVRVPVGSPEFQEISGFIISKRKLGMPGFTDFTIGWYLRKYTKEELQRAEVLRVSIPSHFEPCGEECGTIYETLCNQCNWGRQVSDLVLDLRRAPQGKDIAETISWVEWIVSTKFVRMFIENGLSGTEFKPVVESKNPVRQSKDWHQLRITGKAGKLSENTILGRDPFSPSQVGWRCPLGHAVAAEFLTEVSLCRSEWDGSDIAATSDLFGQGRNLLRPAPLIIISQRLYRSIVKANLSGFVYEVAHLV